MLYLGIAVLLGITTLLLSHHHMDKRKLAAKRSSRPDNISPELYEFLEQADDAYILTHESAEISCFSKYANSSVCNEVIEAIFKNPAKMFGTKNNRERTWSLIGQYSNEILVRKEITHSPIEVKRGIRITLGDHMVEVWKVSSGPRGFLVEDVT